MCFANESVEDGVGERKEARRIEACLTKHPLVREAVVAAVGDGADKRLVAYVVVDPSESLPATLCAHVAGALPDYMVPSAFLRLDAFALTPNGKIDRPPGVPMCWGRSRPMTSRARTTIWTGRARRRKSAACCGKSSTNCMARRRRSAAGW
ncbi:Non-ribosomal peptide synthetase modules (EC 6.3.2.-) (plasmid) [Mycetohabitans rhizoxinica HKI 454]|uniref:Non-ribosomal peptide synthetase modules n=1 Tax=Mycetohabitans rhizoxinica (strain DSM 19002 / CIP 109453 / HKI 454) TaxID=882378 RepID=E5AUY7_MYCRK|nr:non-ribosomal peptide synthetase module [Mycetohabitans sp. B6]CBW76911.1 Non-ribosomal peptide synthetase modules (EC 6.3.2.-) [Mycetohabitans rhizoxinica HKI 454]